jgi:NADPH:quinone reductase-like Zn-dependent oxidoreductase
VLVQAAGSGIGSAAIRIAKSIGCTVVATAATTRSAARRWSSAPTMSVNYNEKNFSTVARRVTDKRGVDVVFEHVGAATWAASLLSLRMGGRLVTCGSTSGVSAETNLMMIFQRQLRIIGSFGCTIRKRGRGLAHMAAGIRPVLDTVVPLERFQEGLERLESRGLRQDHRHAVTATSPLPRA